MSLFLVKDSSNDKIKQLECDSSGNLKVDKVDVSALATDAELSSLNAKVVACDTGSVSGTVSVSAVSGTVACSHASLPLPSGAASESTLSSLDTKVVACDTSSLSTSALQSSANGFLSTLAGSITAGVQQVSSPALSTTNAQVFGSGGSSATVASGATSKSSSVDANGFRTITIFGNSSNLMDDQIHVEVSADNSTFFKLEGAYISVNYTTGDFGKSLDIAARYVRLSRTNSSGSSDSIIAHISGK